jgi:hypothetical protein
MVVLIDNLPAFGNIDTEKFKFYGARTGGIAGLFGLRLSRGLSLCLFPGFPGFLGIVVSTRCHKHHRCCNGEKQNNLFL